MLRKGSKSSLPKWQIYKMYTCHFGKLWKFSTNSKNWGSIHWDYVQSPKNWSLFRKISENPIYYLKSDGRICKISQRQISINSESRICKITICKLCGGGSLCKNLKVRSFKKIIQICKKTDFFTGIFGANWQLVDHVMLS